METNTTHSGPRDFFVHLLCFIALYASAFSLLSLWFEYINIKFPDPLAYNYNFGFEQLRWPMSILFILFPVFILMARWISKQIVIEPARKELLIYKWLVYLTLFVSSVTVIVDLVTLIYNFLGGDLSARFGLKVLAVLVVALSVFGYYIWHLRTDLSASSNKRRVFTWIAIVVVVGSIILGFVFVGSPTSQRAMRFDQQRINDLQGLQYQITYRWQAKGSLPNSLADLQDNISGYVAPLDPKTRASYEYSIKSELTFELCANFETVNSDNVSVERPVSKGYIPPPVNYAYSTYPASESNWNHSTGRVCFSRTIDPELYPLTKD